MFTRTMEAVNVGLLIACYAADKATGGGKASKAKPANVERGRLCFAKGTKPLAVKVPSHLRNKVGTADGETFGKTTGLRVVHFVDAMFRAIAPKGEHTAKGPGDEVLSATLLAEFPKRGDGTVGAVEMGQKTLQSPAAYRAYHNAGKHGCDGGLGDGHKCPRFSDTTGEAYALREAGNRKPKAKAKAKGSKAKAKAKAK